MDLIGTVLLTLLVIIAIIVFGAFFVTRNMIGGFKKGMRQAQKDAQKAARDLSGENGDDIPEDSDARRYYFNKNKKVDKERAEDVSFEEVQDKE